MKIKVSKEIMDYWDCYKSKFNPKGRCTESNILGHVLHWTIPKEVLWLYATNNEEDYEGSQTQIGIKKDGTVVWGFFSHCSCYGYEEYEGEFEELKEDNLIHTEKYYEMKNVDKEILKILKERLKQISKIGLKEDGEAEK